MQRVDFLEQAIDGRVIKRQSYTNDHRILPASRVADRRSTSQRGGLVGLARLCARRPCLLWRLVE